MSGDFFSRNELSAQRRTTWQFSLRTLGLLLVEILMAGTVYAVELPDLGQDSIESSSIESEILDLALDACKRGEAVQARALFKAIREQLEPPPSLLDLIERYEQSNCSGAVRSLERLGIQMGLGWDSNASQGINTKSMILGSGLNAVELELGDAYKPQSSPYAVFGMDRSFKLGSEGMGQVSLQHRDNPRLSGLNLTQIAATASYPFTLFERPGRGQAEISRAWLGGGNYQHLTSVAAQWLLAGSSQPWLLNVSVTRSNYPNQPSQNAQQGEVGLWREKQIDSSVGFFGGVSLHHDEALSQRPGGDRSGWQYQVGVTIGWAEWQIQPRLSALRWNSRDVFSPGLIDVVRRHHLTQFSLQMSRSISQSEKLVLEWRSRSAHDTVPLFTYRGQSLVVYWRLQH